MYKAVSLWVAAAALALPGCAIVTSVPAGSGAEGIAYMLPSALLPVELVYDGSAFELRITGPVLAGDPAHLYALQRSGNVFTSDNVTVSVDATTGLLSAIDVKSEDKTLPALVQLASGLKAESADAGTQVLVFRGLFDPGWERDKVDAFNRRLHHAARAHVSALARESACDAAAAGDACKNIHRLGADLDRDGFKVEVEGAVGERRSQADCSAGFCYRINIPHVVTLNGPGAVSSAVFGLPNRSPTFVMPLERWAFVKTSHDVKLEGGVFKSVTTDRPSSALAVAAAPVDVVKAGLGAVSEVVQLKIDLSGKEKALAEAKVAEIAAKAALDKARLDKADGEAEAAILGRPAPRDPAVLSIRVGRAAPPEAAGTLVSGQAGPGPSTEGAANPAEARASGQSTSGSQGTAAGKP